ncbi:DUF2341 domain-containing protein [Thermococcus henrietii]|uniref:DUF2341 domain-containing protein n=1 Tax=Thermococcus henrietii TaxID=2016361 RepID=UPI000C081DCF|nr:DUF2341 domain-containing protein [Thermococcus henrietii]
MKRRGFVINATVLVLLIPLLLLLATYSNVTSYVIQAQSQATRLKTTQDVVSYLQLDLQNVMRLSLQRALVLSIAYVTTVQPLDNAQLALESLVKYGKYSQISNAGPEWVSREDQFMGNATLLKWLENMRDYLKKMGYIMVTPPTQIVNNVKLTIAPLDSFHIVANVSIPQIVIKDTSGKIVYNSSIPPRGSLYVVVPITNLEDPLIAYLTKGRMSRVIEPCSFAYPNLTPPYYLLTGYGSDPSTYPLRFAAPFSPTISSDKVYYGDTYPGDGALAYVLRDSPSTAPTVPYVFGTSINGSLVSPSSVLGDGDMGVLVFSGRVGQAVQWCNDSFNKRVEFTLSGVTNHSVVLLKFNPSAVPFSEISHNGSLAEMRIYTSTCQLANYWIEKWDSNEILIWLNVTGTDYYIYYSPTSQVQPSRGYLSNVVGNNYYTNVTVYPGQRVFLFNTTGSVFVRYNVTADENSGFNGGVEVLTPSEGLTSVLNVTLDYPYSVNDVQVPIYLNSTWASRIPHYGNESRIEVYSDPDFTEKVPFWIEYWNDSGALIWVRTNLPGNVYIKFGEDLPLTRGNGDEVFLFFDDFSGSSLNTSKWYVKNPRGSYSVSNGILSLKGNNKASNPDVWLWTKKTFPYYRYVIGMRVYIKNQPFWMWYIDNDGWGWMEHIIGLYGHLGDFDVNSGDFDDGIEDGGKYTKNRWSYVEVAVRDYYYNSYHLASFTTYQTLNPFVWNWSDQSEVSYYYRYWQDGWNYYLATYNTSIGLGQFYKGPTEYDFIYVRKYLDLYYLTESVKQLTSSVPVSVQLVDNWTTAGRLFILKNWTEVLSRYQTGTWPVNVPNRYEVDIIPASTLALNFTHEPNSVVSQNSNADLEVTPIGNLSVYLVVNNTADNSAHFAWVFWAPYPYKVITPVLGVPEQKPPTGNYVSAKVFDIQPFISCVVNARYFGVAGAPSFFERLEGGSTAHRAQYLALAQAMQKAVYGRVKYPIGLVSFILPRNLPANLNFLIREQPAVDYIYLDYSDYPGNDPGAMKVLGISATGGISTTPVLDQNFYLTLQTAQLIFGPYAADLLVPLTSG